jgi:hypothetical protein
MVAMTRADTPPRPGTGSTRLARAAVWLPGLLVALGAAVATVHGLYEVAAAAGVPGPIAWLYPLITDGLALVAYTATARLSGSSRRYAWAVVALAAGLSGLAQAAYLAGAAEPVTDAAAHVPVGEDGPVGFEAAPALRFGVGAWPAIAAAIVAHLLYLLAVDHPADTVADDGAGPSQSERAPSPSVADRDVEGRDGAATEQPRRAVGASPSSGEHPVAEHRVVQPVEHPVEHPVGEHPATLDAAVVEPAVHTRPAALDRRRPAALNSTRHEAAVVSRAAMSPARDRAAAQAAAYLSEHDRLPTVSELADRAQVSRGTAATVLKDLRT